MGMEAQHQHRSDAHRRRLDVEHRLAMYQSNALTISGRPYDSLPVVSLTELRHELILDQRLSAVQRAVKFSCTRSCPCSLPGTGGPRPCMSPAGGSRKGSSAAAVES